jgi:hypothetical protein
MAEFMPQSLKMKIRFGTVKTTAYNPYESEPNSRAMNIVPIEEIRVEITSPQRKWKLPFAEVFAMSAVLLMLSSSSPVV